MGGAVELPVSTPAEEPPAPGYGSVPALHLPRPPQFHPRADGSPHSDWRKKRIADTGNAAERERRPSVRGP